MSQLKLYLLGAPRIEDDGAAVALETRKATALLAYLAVTHQRHTRDTLATLFYPEHDQSGARNVLRRTLFALNKTPIAAWLDADRETLGLAPRAGFWCDVTHFGHCLAQCRGHGHAASAVCPRCLSLLAQAAQLYQGDFLAGFTLRDCPEFDDWQFFQAEGLRREFASALERLVQGYITQHDFTPAIDHARRWLHLDRLHEPAHRALMQLYAWTDQPAVALRQYRACVRTLDEELGVEPLAETTTLYQAILEHRLAAPMVVVSGQRSVVSDQSISSSPQSPVSSSQSKDSGLGTYPLIGRTREWATLQEAYARVTGSGQLVAIMGEAGIGKTRLAEEFLAQVRSQGGATLMARCYEGETQLAYAPWCELLRRALQRSEQAALLAQMPAHWLCEAARLAPDLVRIVPNLPPVPLLDGPAAHNRLLASLCEVVVRLCLGAAPGVLLVDDGQWLDAASLELLTYLVRRLPERPLLVLVTWRSEEVAHNHPLHRLLADAQRMGAGVSLALARWDLAEVAALVENAPPLSSEQVTQLYQQSEGLPYFVMEYLAALAITPPVAESAWPMPASVRDLLRARLGRVEQSSQQLLQTASVLGRSFAYHLLHAASGRSEEETVTGLEQLVAAGLVREVGGGTAMQYDFVHDGLRTLVYEEMGLARRRLLHRRIAEALIQQARARRLVGPVAGQVAHHYQLAGQEAQAAEYCKVAGEQSQALFANQEALTHFQTALALGHPAVATLQEAIGDLQTLTGDYHAALTAYETAAARADPRQLPGIEHKLGQVHGRRGAWELAERHFQTALDLQPDAAANPGWQARLYTDWSLVAHRRQQPQRAQTLAQQALALAESSGDRRALAQAHNLLGLLHRHQQAPTPALHHLERSLLLAKELNDPVAQVAALNNLALVLRAQGDLAQAQALTQSALTLCVTLGDRHREAALHNNLADLLRRTGQRAAAQDHVKAAVTLLAAIGEPTAEPGAWQREIWRLNEW